LIRLSASLVEVLLKKFAAITVAKKPYAPNSYHSTKFPTVPATSDRRVRLASTLDSEVVPGAVLIVLLHGSPPKLSSTLDYIFVYDFPSKRVVTACRNALTQRPRRLRIGSLYRFSDHPPALHQELIDESSEHQ
jgi:hypothetical protein